MFKIASFAIINHNRSGVNYLDTHVCGSRREFIESHVCDVMMGIQGNRASQLLEDL